MSHRDIEFFVAGVVAALLVLAVVRLSSLGVFRGWLRPTGRAQGYNFTERVRTALAGARTTAAKLGHEAVGPEHILVGLLETDGVGVAVLTNLHVDLGRLRKSVIPPATQKSRAQPDAALPFTAESKRVLEAAMAAAQELHHNYVGTEHLLLALTQVKPSAAAIALANAGVTAENARAKLP